jgi:hypothetical protein
MARQPAVVPMNVGYYAKYDNFEFRVFMFDPPLGQSDVVGVSCGRPALRTSVRKQGAHAGALLRSGRFPLDMGSIDRFLGARGTPASSRSSAPPRLDGRPSFQRHRRPAGHGVHRSFSGVAENQASRHRPMRNFVLSSGRFRGAGPGTRASAPARNPVPA